MGAILYALEVPPYGGDTLFANQYLAYDTLSDGMKKMLAGLKAVHTDRKVAGPAANRNAYRAAKVRQGDDWRETINTHPVVRTHPETGRKALYVSSEHTIRFKGMTPEESLPIVEFLQAHCTRPEFTARIRWEKGTVGIWDNRCCQHFAINDYHGHRRVMWRLPVGAEVVV
jgi:taurine dioxygenase